MNGFIKKLDSDETGGKCCCCVNLHQSVIRESRRERFQGDLLASHKTVHQVSYSMQLLLAGDLIGFRRCLALRTVGHPEKLAISLYNFLHRL